MLQKLRKNSKGFTLIELMIVIAIVGILAAIAIPNFIAYRSKSYCSAATADVEAVMGAIAEYFADPDNMSVSTASSSVAALTLSNNNTFDITGPTSPITVTVTDASGRCPQFNTTSKTM
jgi:prepilin-type N-terminal cleavage/methylation domain-containing protein